MNFARTPFFTPELSRPNLEGQDAPLSAQYEALELLRDPALLEQIEQGNVSVAMIRPELETSTLPEVEGSDDEIAEMIEEHIEGLGVMAKFAVVFDREAVDEFYTGKPKEVQEEQPPLRNDSAESRWDEFAELMTSGPTTILLLHNQDGEAIERWRAHVGHWNIEANRDPATIRGKFGLDNYNNLIHGSDAPESAAREIDIIGRCIARNIER